MILTVSCKVSIAIEASGVITDADLGEGATICWNAELFRSLWDAGVTFSWFSSAMMNENSKLTQ